MGRLIKAEYRKIITTKLWWALLVPSILLAIGWAWLGGYVFTEVASGLADVFRDAGLRVDLDEMAWASVGLTRAMNFATLFPMVFGALAVASEINRRTITTSFLTAPTRASVLTAKAIVYVLWGVVYGIVVAVGASIGTLLGARSEMLPSTGDWILILLSGILACLLWTLFGMGVGALLGSPVAALLVLLAYAGLIGPLAEIFITTGTGSHVAGLMPNGSANGLTGSTATELLFQQVSDAVAASGQADLITDEVVDGFNDAVRFAAGAPGAFAMWVSGLIFVAWTALFFVTGMARNNTRDIT